MGGRHHKKHKDVKWTKDRGGKKKKKKKKPVLGRARRKTNENDKSLISLNFMGFFLPLHKFYAILCFPGGKCPQNRYFKEQLSLTALAQIMNNEKYFIFK